MQVSDNPQLSEEVVIKEYPKTTFLVEGKQVLAIGNLLLTNNRLVFLRQTTPTEKEVENLQKLSQEENTGKLIQFALTLHKKNFEIPLLSIISAKLGLYFMFTLPQPCLRLSYKATSNRVKNLTFRFNPPVMKQVLMSEFPTLDFIREIKKAVKAQRQATGYRQ